ncbi:hypothetical protein J3E69DRAFT_320752 [Trichoderma sp. SZMC 28015]
MMPSPCKHFQQQHLVWLILCSYLTPSSICSFTMFLFALILPHLSAARPTLWLRRCSCSQPTVVAFCCRFCCRKLTLHGP